MIKRIILLFLTVAFLISSVILFVYYINPYDLKTDNIRSRVFGFDIYRIPSNSMQATLLSGDYIIASKLAYLDASPLYGDVVIFNHKNKETLNKKSRYIKRVIAIAKDKIEINKGKPYVNGKIVKESYVLDNNNKTQYSLNMPITIVEDNHVYVMGDNRDNSMDSRRFGSIPIDQITDKATFILYGVDNRSGNKIK